MKLKIISLIAVLVVGLFIALPLNAVAAGPNTGPSTWSLDSKNDKDAKKLPASVSRMEKNWGPGDNGQSGSVSIYGGSSYIWVSDQAAATDTTIPSGAWILQIVTDSDWGNQGAKCQIEIGEWNGGFNSLTPPPQTIESFNRSSVIIKTLFQSHGITIHKGKYLALRVKSLEIAGKKHTIYTGEGIYNSFLRSPESTPEQAVPELSAGILLALGLAGLGTFIFFQRRSLTSTANQHQTKSNN